MNAGVKAALRDAPTLVAAVLVLLCLGRAWSYGQGSLTMDFYQFWLVGQVIADGPAPNVYSDEFRRQVASEALRRFSADPPSSRRRAAAQTRPVLQTYSTPFLYAVFGALSSGDYERDYQRYLLASLVGAALAIFLVARAVGHAPAVALLAIVLFMGWFEP